MAALNSPAKILKLWHKVNDRFGPSPDEGKGEKKKVSEKDRAAEKQNEKITKGLTALKARAKDGVKLPSQVKAFEGTRQRVVLVMQKYCKLIKSTKLEGAQDMNKFRKAVKQLTIVVEELAVTAMTADEGDFDINALSDVDTAKLDQALEDPNFATADDNFSFDDTAPPPEAPPPPSGQAPPKAPPPPPQSKEAADFLKRIQALESRAGRVIDPDHANELKLLLSAAHVFERKQDYVQANHALDRADKLFDAPTGQAPKFSTAKPATDAALSGWQSAREKAVAELHNLAAAIAKSHDQEAKEALILVNAIIKNLTPSPNTAQSVTELERYLETDDIIQEAEIPNGWGVKVELRAPLLQALGPLKQSLSV